jgi:hypothetical protein
MQEELDNLRVSFRQTLKRERKVKAGSEQRKWNYEDQICFCSPVSKNSSLLLLYKWAVKKQVMVLKPKNKITVIELVVRKPLTLKT